MKEQHLMVGEAAKRLGVSVRTLQYYDNIGLISPSGQSEGGRRLYSDKDTVRLHQVLSLKYLGFSLDEIKQKLFILDTPKDVIEVLGIQGKQIEEQIKSLTEIKNALDIFKNEVSEIQAVDWNKYARIIAFLRNQDERYWIVKHFEEKTMRAAFAKFDDESAKHFIAKMENIWDRAAVLIDGGKKEDSGEAQTLAKEWWGMVTEFTGGDLSILQDLMKFSAQAESWKNEAWKVKWAKTQNFLSEALAAYFEKNGMEGITV
jgi:DNA-binding transcriptional MerR regulator